MDIPVFVSCPTSLNAAQERARAMILRQLKRHKLTPRALGRSDYPDDLPLREVLGIARHCAGGVILGFEQFRSTSGIRKPGTADAKSQDSDSSFPTPWNHLEAGILFGLGLPMLIFREPGISGGIFDPGVADIFVHHMPAAGADDGLDEVFLKWQYRVRQKYYGE